MSSLPAQTGIQGTISLDTSVWAPVAYLSIITNFTQMHTMSYETIIERAEIDSTGNFTFGSNILPEEDRLYRIHFSKKGDPPASLIIGGRDENHFFLIANNHSNIDIQSSNGPGLINRLTFDAYTTLTVQERKIFSLLKEGKSNKEISDECAISLSTVKSHVNNIYSKLQINSRKEALDYLG